MSFIQTGFLFALAGLAIPVIVHLVFRQKARHVDLGTLRFLRVVLQQNARRRQVMRWVLLALRLGCVAALVLLFARPYWLAYQPAGEKETAVVLIDRSATMDVSLDGKRAIEQAIEGVRQLLQQSGENTRFEVALFDHGVHPIVESHPDSKTQTAASASEILSKLDVPKSCTGGTDYGAAMEWARDKLRLAPPGKRHLHVYTDLQQSGLAWSEVDALPADVVSHIHDLGRAAINNVAITEARPERVWIRPEEQTSIHVAVYNGGPLTTPELPVSLKLSNGTRSLKLEQRVKIEPGAVESVRFDLTPLAEGLWQGTILVSTEDDLAVDNERHVAILASKPYQVLLIDGRSAASPSLAATFFLEAALRLAPSGELHAATLFEPHRIAADDALPSLDRFDAVVLADVGDLDRADAGKLSRFVETGGGLLVFCGENVASHQAKNLSSAGLSVGTVQGVKQASDLPLRLEHWDVKHPIFAAFNDPQLGDLQRLSFSACTLIKPQQGAEVLARFRSGEPAVLESKKGKGSVVWFASSCDRQWSDWTRSRLYLPLMYQMLGYQTGHAAGGKVRETVLERDAAALAAEPGVHSVQQHTLVVNLSPREAETDRCTTDEFAKRFGLHLSEEVEPQPEMAVVQASLGTELIDSEFWPQIGIGLLALLVLEMLVANRTTG